MTTRSLAGSGLVVVLTAGAGALAGAGIGLVADIASRSDISFGGMTLRGNGALIVPMLLLPLAIAVGIVLVGKVLVGGARWFAVSVWIVSLRGRVRVRGHDSSRDTAPLRRSGG